MNSTQNFSSSSQPAMEAPAINPKRCAETILVVEDEPDLLELITAVLESRGYNVLGAASGRQALEQWSQKSRSIDLLLTDMTMPDGMTGGQLAERLRNESPNLRVIYTSGHSAGIPGTKFAHIDEREFLAKPYRPTKLLEFVRTRLDGPVTCPPAAPLADAENN